MCLRRPNLLGISAMEEKINLSGILFTRTPNVLYLMHSTYSYVVPKASSTPPHPDWNYIEIVPAKKFPK